MIIYCLTLPMLLVLKLHRHYLGVPITLLPHHLRLQPFSGQLLNKSVHCLLQLLNLLHLLLPLFCLLRNTLIGFIYPNINWDSLLVDWLWADSQNRFCIFPQISFVYHVWGFSWSTWERSRSVELISGSGAEDSFFHHRWQIFIIIPDEIQFFLIKTGEDGISDLFYLIWTSSIEYY